MKKRFKSGLLALLSPFALASASTDVSKLGFSWELSYQPDQGIETVNQVDFSYADFFVLGSVKADGESGTAGLKTGAKSVGKTFGNVSGKRSQSYYDGTRKNRSEPFYVGLNMQRFESQSESEFFAGAKLRNLFFSSFRDSEGDERHKVYAELKEGKVLGFSSNFQEGVESSGIYYSKKGVGAQVNFVGENYGTKLLFSDLLKKTGEVFVDDSETLNLEIGHGNETKTTASLMYGFGTKKGQVKRFYFGLGYNQVSASKTILENRINFGKKNSGNLKLRHETGTNRTDIGIDISY